MGSDKISRVIREARRDSSIKAIVFRVNSGGGSALASEVIWREVNLAARAKPLIASLGDVAGSGGYYIVTPAKKIIAESGSLTGSIGVFGLFLNGRDFMQGKLGITSDVVKTNKYSDLGSFFRPLNPEETMIIQREVDHVYETFLSHVVEGRGMSREEADKLGGGRIYSGKDALETGLIDEIGGLKKAVELAAAEAGLETYRVVELPKKEDPLETIIRQLTGEIKVRILRSDLDENYRYLEQLKRIQQYRGIQALIPFEVHIH
jgi:protease-4